MRNREEIIFALNVLKDICNEHDKCEETCPFYVNDDCEVHEPPSNWKINDEVDSTWKGLL